MTAKKKVELKRTCGKNGVPALMAIPVQFVSINEVKAELTENQCRPVLLGGYVPIRWSVRRSVVKELDPYRWN